MYINFILDVELSSPVFEILMYIILLTMHICTIIVYIYVYMDFILKTCFLKRE